MDFRLSEEQEMLRAAARDFLTKECPKTFIRKMTQDEKGYSPELWRKMAQLGWTGLVIPEEFGGTGGNLLDLCLLMEEMGRVALLGPFFSTVIAGMLIDDMGDRSQKRVLLSKINNGEMIIAIAPAGPGSVSGQQIRKEITEGHSYVLAATKLFVPDAHVADLLMLTFESGKNFIVTLVDAKAPGITRVPVKTIAGDKQCEVTLSEVVVPPNSILSESNRDKLKNGLAKAAIAKCAEMAGGAQQVLEMTTDYVKQRKQFGKHIGSFQIIQQYCANMLIDVDACRFITYDAAWKASSGFPYLAQASIAKAWVNEAYRRVVMTAHQIHGAIGFSDDYDLGLYTKRAKAAELMLGDSNSHREIVASEMGL